MSWWPPPTVLGEPGNWVGFTPSLHQVSQPEEQGCCAPKPCLVLRGFVLHFCCGHSWCQEANGQNFGHSKIQNTDAASRASWAAARLEGRAWAAPWRARGPAGKVPLPTSPPSPCWDSPLWLSSQSLPTSAQGSLPWVIPTAGGSFPPGGPKRLNLEPRPNSAHLNVVVTLGRREVPPDPTRSLLQPLREPRPLSRNCANCLNHALRKASEISNPQAEVLLGVSWPQMF